ncbi:MULTISPECIES: hypothetical protein [Micrococcaceae]|uniref:hypothetical protein n=1 Tax=Micrococcaceae TaxID=1268 RepID=UPI001F1191A3|nr:hypothetical protein [Arthrobacter sp. SF27]
MLLSPALTAVCAQLPTYEEAKDAAERAEAAAHTTAWRDRRLTYTLRINEPVRWIDLTAAESVAVLNRHLGQHLDEAFGVSTITLGTLTDEDREAITAIAEWLREQRC